MFVIEPSIMLARATAYASGRRSMIGKPAPRGARPRAGTRGHLGLTVVVIRGDVVGIDNVVAVATELVVVVSQLERRVIGEGTAATELVMVASGCPCATRRFILPQMQIPPIRTQ